MTVPHATWVLLARIVRPQGRHGEVLADIFTDFPEHFAERKRLFLRPPLGVVLEAMREARLESHWLHKGRVVLKFAQVDSIAEAENLRGFEVVIPREERMPLEGDAVYISDLLGVRVDRCEPGRRRGCRRDYGCGAGRSGAGHVGDTHAGRR